MHGQGSAPVSSPLGFCSITDHVLHLAYVFLGLPSSLSQESYALLLGAFETSLYSWYPLTTLDTANARTICDDKINDCGF